MREWVNSARSLLVFRWGHRQLAASSHDRVIFRLALQFGELAAEMRNTIQLQFIKCSSIAMNWQHSDHEGNLPRIKRATCRASPGRPWVKCAQRTVTRTQSALNPPPPLAARRQDLAKNGLRVVSSQDVTNGLAFSPDLVLIMPATEQPGRTAPGLAPT